MLVLDGVAIDRLADRDGAIAAAEAALCLYERGAFDMPDRLHVSCSAADTLLLMPCVADDHYVTKLVTVFPQNRKQGRPVIDGVVILGDRKTGEVLAVLDAKSVTALRTAAVGAVSTKYLARPDAHTAALIGCGQQGRQQALFTAKVRQLRRLSLFDAEAGQAQMCRAWLAHQIPGVAIEIAASADDAARAAEIIITATTVDQPVFSDTAALFRGKHCIAIGAFQPHAREYPDAIFGLVDRVWVDTNHAAQESGELLIPMARALLQRDQVTTLGKAIDGGESLGTDRRASDQTTFFKSVGMALLDLTTARWLWGQAATNGTIAV
jgi:ornithine cyclodeaminase/alanine dehydrogenase-like protein (mu-crystallin family)